MKNTFLAFDLGTTVGRAVIGELNDGILSLREIHRFENDPVIAEGHSYWNIEFLFREIKKSLVLVADQNLPIESIGITTWGVDFSILDDSGIPSQPIVSQCEQFDGSSEGFAQRISADKIYGQTGIPVLNRTSLFQLSNLKKTDNEVIKNSKHLLFIPDVFNYLLTGIFSTEFSTAATSQLYNPVKRMWDHEIFKALGIPVSIMSRVVEPGSIIGSVSNNVSYETGIARIPVVAVASNATASAIAAIPATGNNWVFINTGSTYNIGFEAARPIINKKSQQLNITNQGGAGPSFLIQITLGGMSLLEDCRKAWQENKYTVADLLSLAGASNPFASFIDTDHASFQNSENLPGSISEYCISTGQNPPQSHGEIVRTILEGIALKFRTFIGQVEDLRGVKSETIYITGDGIENDLLCRFTADWCGIPVITTPDGAAAIGNILIQAVALGIVKNVAEIRSISEKSFPTKTYQPSETKGWEEAYKKYLEITATTNYAG